MIFEENGYFRPCKIVVKKRVFQLSSTFKATRLVLLSPQTSKPFVSWRLYFVPIKKCANQNRRHIFHKDITLHLLICPRLTISYKNFYFTFIIKMWGYIGSFFVWLNPITASVALI